MSKFDELRKQNPTWDVNLFDILKAADPSGTHRYAQFLLKCLKRSVVNPENLLAYLTSVSKDKLETFHKWHEEGLVEAKDILTYTPEEFYRQYENAEKKAKLRDAQNQVKRLHEDDNWLIISPLTFEAGQVYGQATRWCITQQRHWDNYKDKYFYIFVINKKNNDKYAINKDTSNGKFQIWNSADTEIDMLKLPIPNDLYSVIIKELKEHDTPVGVDPNEEKLWKTSDGVVIPIDEMSTAHIENTIKKFKGVPPASLQSKFKYMKLVLKQRAETQAENKMDIISQIVRKTKNFGGLESRTTPGIYDGPDEEFPF
jgi:hypothetical protein